MAQNEINNRGKFWGAFLLILALAASITLLIAIWPDNVPPDNNPAEYRMAWFHVQLVTTTTGKPPAAKDSLKPAAPAPVPAVKPAKPDSPMTRPAAPKTDGQATRSKQPGSPKET